MVINLKHSNFQVVYFHQSVAYAVRLDSSGLKNKDIKRSWALTSLSEYNLWSTITHRPYRCPVFFCMVPEIQTNMRELKSSSKFK